MTRFRLNPIEEIVGFLYFLLIIFISVVDEEYRLYWLIGCMLFVTVIIISRLLYRIIIDETGMTICRNGFSKTFTPWSSIRALVFYRIPLINIPRLQFRVDKNGKLLTISIPGTILHYLTFIQTVLDHTNLQPSPRLQKFLTRSTVEKKSTRFIFSLIYTILFVALLWRYGLAIHSVLFDGIVLILLYGSCAICLGYYSYLRYRHPRKSSGVMILCLILGTVAIYTFGTMFVPNEPLYFRIIPIALSTLLILFIFAIINRITVTSVISTILIGLIFYAGFFYSTKWMLNKIVVPHKYVTPTSGFIDNLTWSPDGTRIAMRVNEYELEKENSLEYLYTISIPGYSKTSTRLDNFSFRPAWSPDGKKLLVPILASKKNMELRVYEADLKTYAVLDYQTTSSLSFYIDIFNPEHNWSPGGKYLVYRYPVPKKQKIGQKLILYNTLKKTNETLVQLNKFIGFQFWLNPTTVRFSTYKETTVRPPMKYYSIWDINILQKKPKLVYQSKEPWKYCYPIPNKKYFAVSTTASRLKLPLYLYSMDSFDKTVLPQLKTEQFIFHPKEDRILCIQTTNKTMDIVEYDLITQSTRKIFTEPGEIQTFIYSPNGKYIVYSIRRGLGGAIHAVSSDGKKYKVASLNILSTMIFFMGNQSPWAWSPDGEQLIYPITYLRNPPLNYLYISNFK